MTAEEARKRTEEFLLKKEDSLAGVDLDAIYLMIDMRIEDAAGKGENSIDANVDGCDETWETVLRKREEILRHYTNLGYDIENHGYDRCITADNFRIQW